MYILMITYHYLHDNIPKGNIPYQYVVYNMMIIMCHLTIQHDDRAYYATYYILIIITPSYINILMYFTS